MDKIHIWNMALGFIGTRTIAAEEERAPEAIQCALFWDSARRQVLRDFPYNFAQRRQWLAAVPVPEGWEIDWRFAYALPDACLKAHKIYSHTSRAQGKGERGQPFMVASTLKGETIVLCSAAPALLCYTADITDVNCFDDTFIALVARKLAALIAVPLLKHNSARVQELEERYRASLPAAAQAAASEGYNIAPTDAWLAVR